MQGRQGQGNDPRNRPSGQRISPMNGTGRHRSVQSNEPDLLTGKIEAISSTTEHRAIPQRPPGLRRLDTPPQTPRVARPSREQARPRSLRKRLIMWGSIFLISAIVAGFVGWGAYKFSTAINFSSGAASTTTDFLNALSKSDYNQAFSDLGPSITLNMGPEDFKAKVQAADKADGAITDYKQVPDSTVSQDNKMIYTYEITRSKQQKPVQIHLTLLQSKDGTWQISDYENLFGQSGGTQNGQ